MISVRIPIEHTQRAAGALIADFMRVVDSPAATAADLDECSRSVCAWFARAGLDGEYGAEIRELVERAEQRMPPPPASPPPTRSSSSAGRDITTIVRSGLAALDRRDRGGMLRAIDDFEALAHRELTRGNPRAIELQASMRARLADLDFFLARSAGDIGGMQQALSNLEAVADLHPDAQFGEHDAAALAKEMRRQIDVVGDAARKPRLHHCGTWTRGHVYARAAAVTHGGRLWAASIDGVDGEPGIDSAWLAIESRAAAA
jgi:hypothetical protein